MVRAYSVDCLQHLSCKVFLRTLSQRRGIQHHASFYCKALFRCWREPLKVAPDTKIGIYSMKKTILTLSILASVLLIAGCGTPPKLIGEVNMISTRNISTDFNYQQLTAYSGGSNRQLKKSKSTNIQDAVTQTVKSVPGGEFLMNVKIYLVNNQFYAVEGDVWGHSIESGGYQGYKIGDPIMWKDSFSNYKKGKIIAIKDTEKCVVEDESGRKYTIKFDDLMRSTE